jgi:hypothetical protein
VFSFFIPKIIKKIKKEPPAGKENAHE